MKRIVSCAAAMAVLLAAGCASSDPGDLDLAAGAPDSILLLKAKVFPAEYWLNLSSFDESQGLLTSSLLEGGGGNFVSQYGQTYLAEKLKPGTYVFTGIMQSAWTNCFQDGTWRFTVEPGTVLYLGEFDPAPALLDMQKKATARGETMSINNQLYFYFDNVPSPAFSFGADRSQALAQAQAYVQTQMPKVSAPVKLAEYAPAKFGTGTDAFGLKRVCGGYYKQPRKE
jgi:hypothetical protein